MISIQGLNKSYTKQVLFDEASFQMGPGERVGLIGRNGHGKSTLFRIILGQERADEGKITFPKNYRIGHLEQHIHFTKPTVLEEGCLGLLPEEEYDHYKVEQILFGLGFTKTDMDRHPSEFSGGFQVRLNLTKALVARPNLLLLDEPTNYLDIVSIRWIRQFLRQWENEMILISHDRDFMDSVTTHTALIHRSTIRKIEGGTLKLSEQVAEEEEIHEKTRVNEEKQRKHVETFVNRFRAQATKASAVQSRVKLLEKMPAREKLARIANLDFKFRHAAFTGKTLLDVQNVSFHFDPNAPLVRNLNFQIEPHDRIAIIGKNGRGKSTLLNLLAGNHLPTLGKITPSVNQRLGFFGQTNIERLSPNVTVESEIQSANTALGRTEVRTICGIMMFSGTSAEKKISVLSGGEKSRVLLGKILAAPANLLFLDEPTNHLDMQSIEALVESIQQFAGAVVIVTHSEMILREVATKLIVFQNGETVLFNGSYDEFLEKVGWSDESSEQAMPTALHEQSPAILEQNDDELLQKRRTDLLTKQASVLSPIEKQIEELKAKNKKIEEDMPALKERRDEASVKLALNDFSAFSKSIKANQAEIEKNNKEFGNLTKKYDEKRRKYEILLSELGST
ncbi:MAG: ATP-binding cassette domain-containing protein [Nitrospirota bacterium]